MIYIYIYFFFHIREVIRLATSYLYCNINRIFSKIWTAVHMLQRVKVFLIYEAAIPNSTYNCYTVRLRPNIYKTGS